jgi:hypothetical protein
MEKHALTVVILITNRFDFPWQEKDFYELYSKMSHHPRVRVVADNEYDIYWASRFDLKFFTRTIMRSIIDYTPTPAPVLHEKLFVYNRGTDYNKYKDFIPVSHDVYGPSFERFRDRSHVQEYKGFLHLPYQSNVISLWENLAGGVVYFIPSKKLVKQWIREGWYNWEETYKSHELAEISLFLSEWYRPDFSSLFVYFDSWDDLSHKVSSTDVPKKRLEILEFLANFNQNISMEWKNLLDLS